MAGVALSSFKNRKAMPALRDAAGYCSITNQSLPPLSVPINRTPHGAALETPPGDPYENAPRVNFVHQSNRDKMREAINEVRGRLGRQYPLVIDGQKIWTGDFIDSINPSSPKQVVGAVA